MSRIISYHQVTHHFISSSHASFHTIKSRIISYHQVTHHFISSKHASVHTIKSRIIAYHQVTHHCIPSSHASLHTIKSRIIAQHQVTHHCTEKQIMNKCHIFTLYNIHHFYISCHHLEMWICRCTATLWYTVFNELWPVVLRNALLPFVQVWKNLILNHQRCLSRLHEMTTSAAGPMTLPSDRQLLLSLVHSLRKTGTVITALLNTCFRQRMVRKWSEEIKVYCEAFERR